MEKGVNLTITKESHKLLVEHLKDTSNKIGKWADLAIREKIQKEKSQSQRIEK